MSEKGIKLLGISGSSRKGSYNNMLLESAKSLLPNDVTLEVVSIGELPLFSQDAEKEALPKEVVDLKKRIKEADGIVICTPEYNYTIPAMLKNALEWSSRPYGDNAFDRKPVAVMSASTEMGGGTVAQYHLRQVLVYLNAFVINKPVVMVPEAQNRFDNFGRLSDKEIRMRLQSLLASFANWTRVIAYGVENDLIV
jgi:chromate reductase